MAKQAQDTYPNPIVQKHQIIKKAKKRALQQSVTIQPLLPEQQLKVTGHPVTVLQQTVAFAQSILKKDINND